MTLAKLAAEKARAEAAANKKREYHIEYIIPLNLKGANVSLIEKRFFSIQLFSNSIRHLRKKYQRKQNLPNLHFLSLVHLQQHLNPHL